MKVYWTKLSVFLLLFGCAFIGADLWCSRVFKSESNNQYSALGDSAKSLRMIIMGSSRAFGGIHPKFLEPFDDSVYGFAMNSNRPLFYLSWYRKLFKGHFARKPRTVLFCVDWNMFHPVNRKFENDSEYWPASFFMKTLLFDREVSKRILLMSRFASIKNRSEILSRLIHKYLPDSANHGESYKGHVPYISDQYIPNNEAKNSLSPEDEDPAQHQAFLDLMEDFRKDGVHVILVGVPDFAPELENKKKEIDAWQSFIQKYAKESGIVYLDYNSEKSAWMNNQQSLYYNRTHLNQQGSLLFTRVLRDDLLPLLPQQGTPLSAYESFMWAGDYSRARGNDKEALASYFSALEADPNQYAPHEKMGLIHVKNSRQNEAFAEFNKVTRLNPNYARGFMLKANILAYNKMYSEAEPIFKKAIDLNPGLAQARYGLGTALLRQGKVDEAVKQLEMAAALNPNNMYYFFLATAYLRTQRYSDAVWAYISMANNGPLDFDSCMGFGTACAEMKMYDKALLIFSKASEMSPNNPAPYEIMAALSHKTGNFFLEGQMSEKAQRLRGSR